MWQQIAESIEAETSQPFNIQNKQIISGGDINDAYKISGENKQYFVKLNTKDKLEVFIQESYSLAKLKQQSQFVVPNVITLGTTLDKSYLVQEFIPLTQGNLVNWQEFGETLAIMHRQTIHGKFGWPEDNFIGTSVQFNAWSTNWSTFFSENRIAVQLQLLGEKSISLGNIDHITAHCHDILHTYRSKPCLLHGDLWQGNTGFTANKPCVYDPASYFGDREADIAMTELFGNFPDIFYQSYQNIYPLDSGYEARKLVYHFYHILNHANLFGGVYIEQAKATLQRILSAN